MKTFSGFASGRTRLVRLPTSLFTELIPLIDDLSELKLTLHVLWRLGRQRGKTHYVRLSDLASDEVLRSSLAASSNEKAANRRLQSALSRAVERGTLLRTEAPGEADSDTLYFANTPKGRAAVEAISGGTWPKEIEVEPRSNIFMLYEQNIGMLTPLISDELREAERTYPPSWIEDAFREAVNLNKRSWRYIHAILERWSVEGKDEDQGGRDAEADRRRYLEWKHG